jgi:hypothetical protein
VEGEGSLIFSGSKYAISVDMEQWSAEHRPLVVKTFPRQNELAVVYKMACIVIYGRQNKRQK